MMLQEPKANKFRGVAHEKLTHHFELSKIVSNSELKHEPIALKDILLKMGLLNMDKMHYSEEVKR